MDLALTEEQQLLREMVRELAARDIAPYAAQIDKAAAFPLRQFQSLAAADLLGIPFPEAYGGMGGTYLDYVIALEEVCRACASTGVTMSVQISLAGMPLQRFGTDEQRQRFLAPLCRGSKIGAYSLSEANSGTDAASLTCQARRLGEHYLVNGTKMWVTNGYHADTYIVYVTVDPSLRHKGIT
ncbi:MAG: acyl-CoA dehydrogenase family protein, partial [Cyanobacteria bacterium REEB65]|nr:acyl-CoA dehydrogenase family protein [Cyanobacteria bacterium REEB65]